MRFYTFVKDKTQARHPSSATSYQLLFLRSYFSCSPLDSGRPTDSAIAILERMKDLEPQMRATGLYKRIQVLSVRVDPFQKMRISLGIRSAGGAS